MCLSQKTPVQLFPPLCSLLAGSGHLSSLMIYRALPTYLPKHYHMTDVNQVHGSNVPSVQQHVCLARGSLIFCKSRTTGSSYFQSIQWTRQLISEGIGERFSVLASCALESPRELLKISFLGHTQPRPMKSGTLRVGPRNQQFCKKIPQVIAVCSQS